MISQVAPVPADIPEPSAANATIESMTDSVESEVTRSAPPELAAWPTIVQWETAASPAKATWTAAPLLPLLSTKIELAMVCGPASWTRMAPPSLAELLASKTDSVTDDATATQAMPDVIRWGLRYNYGKGEARLFGDYARWSLFEKQCISTKGRDDCDLANIPRNWEDAFSVRFGYSYFMNDMIELYFGGGYDGNAVPDEYLEPALYDAEKFSGAFGGRFRFEPGGARRANVALKERLIAVR